MQPPVEMDWNWLSNWNLENASMAPARPHGSCWYNTPCRSRPGWCQSAPCRCGRTGSTGTRQGCRTEQSRCWFLPASRRRPSAAGSSPYGQIPGPPGRCGSRRSSAWSPRTGRCSPGRWRSIRRTAEGQWERPSAGGRWPCTASGWGRSRSGRFSERCDGT